MHMQTNALLCLGLLLGGCGLVNDPGQPGAPDAAHRRSLGSCDCGSPGSCGDRNIRPDRPRPDLSPPHLGWGKCDVAGWFDGLPLPPSPVECTSLPVPLDYAHPEGARVQLRIARLRAKTPTGRVVFHVAGGPGNTAVGLAATLPQLMPQLGESFDQVFVDQRGAGFSDQLACSAGTPQSTAEWQACAAEQKGRDLDRYLTLDAVRDLEQVRRALGYNKIHLAGGSYGSRVVLEYLRYNDSQVAAAFMISLAPPDWTFFGDGLRSVDLAVKRLATDCGKDAACQELSADLVADLAARRQALHDQPRPILVDGKPMVEDEQSFVSFLGLALDAPALYFKLPRAVREAMAGDNTAWNSVMGAVAGASIKDTSYLPRPGSPALRPPPRPTSLGLSILAEGLYATVACAEWLPNEGGLAALQALSAKQTWASPTLLDLAAACPAWKVAPLPAFLRAPVSSPASVLLMSGALDLRTPPANAEHVRLGLPNARHLVVPYAGHADTAIALPCVAQIATAFLKSDGNHKAVDASCLSSLKPPAW